MEQFDGHFGALSAVAKGSTVVMEALAMATTTQYEKILSIMAELETLSIAAAATTGGGNRGSSTSRITPYERTKSNLRINQLMSAIKGKWVPGGATESKTTTTKPGRKRRAATIKIPRALILPVLAETRTNIGIIFCCGGGGGR